MGLYIKIPNMVSNWKKRGDFLGFWRVHLEKEARELEKAKKWDAFGDVLALLTFWLVLFPTYEDFVDSTTISIF